VIHECKIHNVKLWGVSSKTNLKIALGHITRLLTTTVTAHAHSTVVLINCSYSSLRNIFTIGQPQIDVANM